MEHQVAFAELRAAVQQLVGQRAWGSRAGSGAGSIFTLQFGESLADAPEWGVYSILVYCAWRLTNGADSVCTWHEEAREVLAPSLARLHGSEVQAATLSKWGDLRLDMHNGFSLHLFADLPEENECNWFISLGRNQYYSWNTDFTASVEDH